MQKLETNREEIRDLRDWAQSDGDTHTMALCDRALQGDMSAWMLCAMLLQDAPSN